MPRQARTDAHGALHHIVVRGIERRAIFTDDKDRVDFLERLSGLLQETVTPCYAWALMTNHVHLLLRTGTVPIATIMRRLLTGYAVRFNRRHARYGHLFQNRYKSILCEEEGVDTALMGKRVRAWQDTQNILALFGRGGSEARQNHLCHRIPA